MPLTLHELGWQNYCEVQVQADEFESAHAVRVVSHQGRHLRVLSQQDEFLIPVALLVDGPTESTEIAVGDWLLIDSETHRLVRALDRKSLIYRKAPGTIAKNQLAANVDTVFIVCSCNQDFSLARLERYLALVLDAESHPVVVLTKADLCSASGELRQQVEKLHSGLLVETLDARSPEQVDVLEYWCRPGQTLALVGSSGVGKSTLANTLGDFGIATADIRQSDAKGRHTTTVRAMHRLRAGGWLIDMPGMRELQLPGCEDGINELFADVLKLSAECVFRDCNHNGDQGCALHAAVGAGELDPRRLSSFLKLRSEQARNATTLAERREKDRKMGRFYKRVISEKKKRR